MRLKFSVLLLVIVVAFMSGCSKTEDKPKVTKQEVKALPGSVPEPSPIDIPGKISEIKGSVIDQVVPKKDKYKKGIFWRVERPGYKPSFLLGTMHSPHPDVLALTKVISKQFARTTTLCTEIKMDFGAMGQMQKALLYPEGQSLRKTIGDEMFNEVVKRVKHLGLDAKSVNRIKPWAVNMQLGMPKSNGKLALDMQLALNAGEQSKELCGLEKIKEQIDVLSGLTETDQVRALKITLKHYDKVQEMSTKLRKMYLSRNLAAMSDMVENSPVPVPKADMEKMIFSFVIRRNIIMANRMQPYLKKGNVFFAVGALHLPGKGGLLRLLESQGYKLTRLY